MKAKRNILSNYYQTCSKYEPHQGEQEKTRRKKQKCSLCAYYGLGMNNKVGMCKDCKNFSNFKKKGNYK